MWTTPQTWTTGQLVTASDMNTDIRDNVGHLGGLTSAGTALSALSAGSEIASISGIAIEIAESIGRSTNSSTTWQAKIDLSITPTFEADAILAIAQADVGFSNSSFQSQHRFNMTAGNGSFTLSAASNSNSLLLGNIGTGFEPGSGGLGFFVPTDPANTTYTCKYEFRTNNGSNEAEIANAQMMLIAIAGNE